MNSTVAFVSDGRGKGFYWDGVGMKGRGRGLNRELDSFPNTGVLAGEHHGCLYTKSGGGGVADMREEMTYRPRPLRLSCPGAPSLSGSDPETSSRCPVP